MLSAGRRQVFVIRPGQARKTEMTGSVAGALRVVLKLVLIVQPRNWAD